MINLPPLPGQPHRTVVTDIDIPFGRLVAVILKFMIASIPAIICLYAIMGAILLVVMMVFGGLGAALGGLQGMHK